MFEVIRHLPTIIVKWVTPNIRQFWETRQPHAWILALIIGLSVSVAAIIFRVMIGYVQLLWLGDASENVASAAAKLPWYIVLLGPMAGGLVVGMFLVYLLPSRRALGVPDVIEARSYGGKPIEFKSAIYSALATIISLGSGASAGREGPMVHLGAAISTAFSNFIKMPKWSDRTLLACGVASAVSASFNAPMAGVLFAHEVILGHYSMRAFVPIVISSVSGTIFSRLYFGNIAAFDIPQYQITSLWEFPAFVLLGVTCAVVAILFQFALISGEYVARNVNIPLWSRPVIGGAMIGTIAIFLPEILGVGYEATDKALNNQLPLVLMFTLIIAKTLATSITLASRFGGGVFSPSLYLGAVTGGTFGIIAASIFPQLASSEGLYALLGMGAVAAAVLGAPLSTTLIVFELTGGYSLTIALLLVVSIANGISNAIHGKSIFQWQLELRGIFLQDGPHHHQMKARKVMDFMVPVDPEEGVKTREEDQVILRPTDSLEHALRTFDACGMTDLPVVDETDGETIIAWANQVKALNYCNNSLVETFNEAHYH